MSIPRESHTEGCLVRKSNSRDPGFGTGVTNALEEEIIFGRHTRESSGSSTNAARARQEGWMPSRRNPHTKQGHRDYRGRQGLLTRVEMGKAQALLCTQQTPPHRQPYVTSVPSTTPEPCFPSQSAFPDGRRQISPLQIPGQPRGTWLPPSPQLE